MKVFRRHQDDAAIAALAVPALGALAADPLYSLVDTALVGNLGSSELGAVAVGTAAFTASFWLFSFLAYGVTPKVARALSRGNTREATDVGVQALIVAVLAGAALTVIGLLFTGPIVRLLGASGEVERFAIPYLRIRVCSAAFVLIAQVGHGWLRGAQNTKTPMLIAITGAVANAVLDYVLIYPAGMGVAGAAWATLITQGCVALVFLRSLVSRFDAFRWRLEREVVVSLLKVGADLIIRTGSLLAALTIATSLAARMGTIELASWQIAMQIFLLLSLTMDSIAIAAQALVARHLGTEQRAAAARVSGRLLELGFLLGIGLGLVLFLLRGPISSIFTSESEVQEAAERLIMWLALIQPIAAGAFTLDGILIGALETRFLAYAMTFASVVFIAVAVIAYQSGWSTTGLAAGAGAWLAIRTATTWVHERRVLGIEPLHVN